jgi:hypothetical protein
MSKRISKYKGTRYIAQTLRKYYESAYPSYTAALPKAREIKAQLDSLKQPVQVKNIKALLRTGKTGRKAGPEIDPKLLQVSYYFELVDYPVYIARCSNELWFKSKLFAPGVPDIQGGSLPDYEKYFASFVNYVNSMAALSDPEEKRYDTEWNVKCTVPKFNRSKKRWESEILSIDANENEYNYGFDPKKPTKEPKDLILTKGEATTEQITRLPEEKPQEVKGTPETAQIKPQGEERIKQIRALIADLRQDVKDGLITKEFYQQEVAKLTSKLENGGEV